MVGLQCAGQQCSCLRSHQGMARCGCQAGGPTQAAEGGSQVVAAEAGGAQLLQRKPRGGDRERGAVEDAPRQKGGQDSASRSGLGRENNIRLVCSGCLTGKWILPAEICSIYVTLALIEACIQGCQSSHIQTQNRCWKVNRTEMLLIFRAENALALNPHTQLLATSDWLCSHTLRSTCCTAAGKWRRTPWKLDASRTWACCTSRFRRLPLRILLKWFERTNELALASNRGPIELLSIGKQTSTLHLSSTRPPSHSHTINFFCHTTTR